MQCLHFTGTFRSCFHQLVFPGFIPLVNFPFHPNSWLEMPHNSKLVWFEHVCFEVHKLVWNVKQRKSW